ncbi:unnamed protein product [Discula destructiva]
MGWGWPFSSSPSPAAPPPNPTEARIAPPISDPQNATVQTHQLELLRLEKERLELMIKIKQEEAARSAAAQPNGSSLPTSQQAFPQTGQSRALQEPWRRSATQLGLFFAGAAFLTTSAVISKRAVNRKMIASYPKLFQPSHHGPKPPPRAPQDKSDDQLVALEALGLATLNVMSFGVMLTGGLMFAFDISNVDELRSKARSSLYGPNGVVDEAAEQEVEDWIVDVLSRRDKNEGNASDVGGPKKDV